MSNAIVEWKEIQSMGEVFYKSGMFKDVASAMQAMVKIQAGSELGLPPFASMAGINIIQGKPVLGANSIATLIKNDPRYDYRIIEASEKNCTIEFIEGGKVTGKTSFSIAEAQTAGLTGKDNWKKYPSDMLFARTISRGSRRFTPGIFGGSPVYTPDEMGVDVDEEGYIDTEFVEQPEQVEQEDKPPVTVNKPAASMTLETAMEVTNHIGEMYGTLESDKLEMMTIGIKKGLKNDITQDQRDEYQMKLDAIALILASRR